MPAIEERSRAPRGRHVALAVASLAMAAAIAWMALADHLRPWKQTQRRFHAIERAKLLKERDAERAALDPARLDALDARLAEAAREADANARPIRAKEKALARVRAEFERLDLASRSLKVRLDAHRAEYGRKIDRGRTIEARAYLDDVIAPTEREWLALRDQFEAARSRKIAAEAEVAALRGNPEAIEAEREAYTRDLDRADRRLARSDPGLLGWLRGFPTTEVRQVRPLGLTIDAYSGAAPRVDRCQTCHLGIDRPGYSEDDSGDPMPAVFRSHPHLTDGASTADRRAVAGLYLDAHGPHPLGGFGCTICHGGNGPSTDFNLAAHAPNGPEQADRWREAHGRRGPDDGSEPMLPARFIEASCLKCHRETSDLPRSSKLRAGYDRVVQSGCAGCHAIGGEGSPGPDLTRERRVGPDLRHIGSKVSKDWMLKWIKDPHAFRPDSRMPRFYDLSNNSGARDRPRVDAEVHAMAHYLFARSVPPPSFVEPQAKGSADPDAPPAQASSDAGRGKELFFQKGCMACHAHKDFAPETFPASVRRFAKADHGPDLSAMALKFPSNAQGYRWLANWIKAPEAYHPDSLMPNLQLSWKDAGDIASWLLSVKGEWPRPSSVPDVESAEVAAGVDDLVKLHVVKSGWRDPASRSSRRVEPAEVDRFVAGLGLADKLMYLGEKTIGRLGCFGCHAIAGFEAAKPVGRELDGWGSKAASRLDFGHVAAFVADKDEDIDEFYKGNLARATRTGFLYEKLHRPRGFDYLETGEGLKSWDDRLRMPRYAWADDPRAVEEVMTFVLGLTGEKVDPARRPEYARPPSKGAEARGSRVMDTYNCAGCHVLAMPRYTVEAGAKLEEALTDFEVNVRVAYANRANDYLKELYPGLTWDEKTTADDVLKGLPPHDGRAVAIEAMPAQEIEDDLSVQLWRPVTIRGFTFNVGDTLTLDRTKVTVAPAIGGGFAWLYAATMAERGVGDVTSFWNRLPPPLIREGAKAQTSWLASYLRDPYPIRPAANLRMPRFHFDGVKASREIADHFAAVDGMDSPIAPASRRADDLAAGWRLMTKGACVQCHAIGPFRPTGGPNVVNGPDLRQVAARFRPGYLAEWLARPNRLVPYTSMPQNVPPRGPAAPGASKSMEGKPWLQVEAMRDTLLDYATALEAQFIEAVKPAEGRK